MEADTGLQPQPLMTKLPVLTSGHGTTPLTLIHRSGHCYQLHRPHLALPPQTAAQPHKKLKTDPETQLEPVPPAAATKQQRQQQQALATSQLLRQEPHQRDAAQHVQQTRDRQRQRARTRQPATSSTHVSSLYPEILAHIFSHLEVRDRGRAAQVCVAWREASYHRSVWRGVTARLHLRRHSQAVFQCLERRGIKRIQVLSLTAKRSLGDVLRGVPKLQSLNLSGCYNMVDSALKVALNPQSYPALTRLNLSLCKNITDASLGMIGQSLKNLEVLELGGCGQISNVGLHLIAWGLKNLRRLELRSCWNISDQGLVYLAGLHDENGGTKKLEHLCLQDCMRMTDEGLRHISNGLATSLKSINLSFCVSITDIGLKHVAKITSLRELNLRSCDGISETGVAYLAEGGSRISHLDVNFCDKFSDQALHHIGQGLFNLRSLSMSACPITDDGIAKIAKTQQDLETLHIGQCSRLTDKSVNTIVEGMPRLRSLDLYGCTKISKHAIEKLKVRTPPISLNRELYQPR